MVDFSNCRSLSEMGRLLGYNYYNAGVKRKIIKVCKDNGIDPYKIIDGNNKMKDSNVCLNCGKEIKHTKNFVIHLVQHLLITKEENIVMLQKVKYKILCKQNI